MLSSYPELAERVHSQRLRQPELYGGIDFDLQPHRLATKPSDASALPARLAPRGPLLADAQLVELISLATMLGDVVADPYASLMATRSFKSLIEMLQRACRRGIDAVPDAPPELAAFLAAMEATPAWLDMELVREGARLDRIPEALLSPYLIRGVFVATFMNEYAALPMALTGALGSKQAARRVKETATFFSVTGMPGALDRRGPGFEAAAMVRLMHSMVRFNALRRGRRWDAAVFGIPIPQVDQVPAGLIRPYVLAMAALAAGRDTWNDRERALVEFARYRCFLLGLPEELLPSTPQRIVSVFHGRAAMLRDGFDDATCGALVRATMSARLRSEETAHDRVVEAFERSLSKFAFIQAVMFGDRRAAARVGVKLDVGDMARVAIAAPLLHGRFLAIQKLNEHALFRELTDAYVLRTMKRNLARYGRAEFTTDASEYAPPHAHAAPA